jgi:hypothetical protein
MQQLQLRVLLLVHCCCAVATSGDTSSLSRRPDSAAPAVPAVPRPPNAANRTVFAIRPINLIGLENKDSADPAGDIFFWVKDRILHPMRCRRTPSWYQCNTSGILETSNQVYAQFTVEYDTQAVGRYSNCNPDPRDPSGATWHCSCHHSHGSENVTCGGIGLEEIATAVPSSGQFPGDTFSPLLAKTLAPGIWLSTQSNGECGNPATKGVCNWRVAERGKMVHADCLNANLAKAVAAASGGAVAKCEAPPLPKCDWLNASATNMSDCCVEAFFTGITAMGRDKLLAPFLAAFASTDPSRGGCASVPHPSAVPTASSYTHSKTDDDGGALVQCPGILPHKTKPSYPPVVANTSLCPKGMPCCHAQFSPNGYGCSVPVSEAARKSAACGSLGGDLAPNEKMHCCKMGPALPPSTTLKNVLVIGDSVSIGYVDGVARILAGSKTAAVQHGPWDISDGGTKTPTVSCRNVHIT